jgi:hypothetical protein
MLRNHSFPHPRLPSGNLNSAQTREITTKRRGELAEMAFHLKATQMGFRVFKPYGDSERYDFILDSGKRLWTVQVKSTTTILNGRYHVNSHRRTNRGVVAYDPSEIDVLVAYIIPEDAWFILPIQAILTRTSLLFCFKDDPKGGLYGAYREAWHLLREPDASNGE